MKLRISNRLKVYLKDYARKNKLGTMRASLDHIFVKNGSIKAPPPRLTAPEKAVKAKKFREELAAAEALEADKRAKLAESQAKQDREAADKLLKQTEETRKAQAEKSKKDQAARDKIAEESIASSKKYEQESTARGRKELAKKGKLPEQQKDAN